MRIVKLVHLDPLYFCKLLYTTLDLNRFCRFVPEPLNKFLCVGYLLLLVLVSSHLLFYAFLPQHHKFAVVYSVVVDTSEVYLDRSVGNVINKSTVVAHKHDGLCFRHKKVFEPLYGFDIQVIGRLVEQQHIRTSQKQLGKFDTHAPATAELRCRTIEILSYKSETYQSFLHLGLTVFAGRHRKLLGKIANTLDKFLIRFAFVVGPFRKFLRHSVQALLHIIDMCKNLTNLLNNRVSIRKNHLLRQITDCNFIRYRHTAGCGLLESGNNFQHRGFAGPVLSHKSNLVLGIDYVIDIIEQHLTAEFDAKIVNGNHS